MFKKFNSTYRYKWKYVTFENVISLVEKIDFKIGDDIPILTKIDKLHFDGFENYWGEGFVGLVRLVLKNGLDGTGKSVSLRLDEAFRETNGLTF